MTADETTASRQQGFTLIELSIVLVIIGLLVGGVLAGKALIQQAEIRAATSPGAFFPSISWRGMSPIAQGRSRLDSDMTKGDYIFEAPFNPPVVREQIGHHKINGSKKNK